MIKVLDKSVADKIAAGEVIERPASVIKELVENSIDAGAANISVEIKKGGKAYMRVTDDGCGMEEDDVPMAFLRHATSKISTAKDLESLETLGFRGEALASVCAVSRLELITRRREDRAGLRTVAHGGEIISSRPAGCPEGTTVIVSDLFYNTPARLKFMKSDAAESGRITELVSRFALAYGDIAFRLISNGSVLFSTSGDGNRLSVIERIFPDVDTANLVPVEKSRAGLSVSGFISTPAMSRTGRSGQIFFVNGRTVNSPVIERGLKSGYSQRLFEGRFPVAFLFLEADPAELDVNIHPNKMAVRFDNEAEVEALVSEAVKEALSTGEAVVRAAGILKKTDILAGDGILSADRVREEDVGEQINIKNIMSTDGATEGEANGVTAGAQGTARTAGASQSTAAAPYGTAQSPRDAGAQVTEGPYKAGPRSPESPATSRIEPPSRPEPAAPAPLPLKPAAYKPFDFNALTVTGFLFGTYITAVDEDSFYIIDQHAAHERVFYEKLVSEYDRSEKASQTIMIPIIMDVPPALSIDDESWLAPLRTMGFSIEGFGQNSYRITEIPVFMELSEAEGFVRDFIDGAGDERNMQNSVVINKLIMRACKSAVKAHDHLKYDEAVSLIDELKGCVNPFSCPHGRPTFIKLTEHEIERLFKRV